MDFTIMVIDNHTIVLPQKMLFVPCNCCGHGTQYIAVCGYIYNGMIFYFLIPCNK